jgi:hypothetical protein
MIPKHVSLTWYFIYHSSHKYDKKLIIPCVGVPTCHGYRRNEMREKKGGLTCGPTYFGD